MTVRIGDTVPANRQRDDDRPAEVADTRRRLRARSSMPKRRIAWLSHLDFALPRSRA